MEPPRFLFVFSGKWSRRVAEFDSGEAPREAAGLLVLRERGYDADAVDSSLGANTPLRVLSAAYQRLYAIPRSGLGYRIHQAHAVRRHVAGDPCRWIVATTDALALPLLALKERERLPNPIVYMSIGLVDRIRRGVVRPHLARRYLQLMSHASVVLVYGSREARLLAQWLPELSVRVMPFGVDVDWWAPPLGVQPIPATVLSTGRDPARSFWTLAEAVHELPVQTTILSSLARTQGVPDHSNVRVIERDSMTDVRREMWRHQMLALPIKNVDQPSGQSSALHAMAAARPVIATDTGWAAEAGLCDGEHFLHVPAEDAPALRRAIVSLADDAATAAAIGAAAQAAVRSRLTPLAQADALLEAVESMGP